jgi:TonB family protein
MILTPMVIADAPTCAKPYVDLAMVKAADLKYPDSARNLGLGRVTILIQLSVNADGSVASAQIQQSSNNLALDQAALQAARQSVYSPMIVNCEAKTANAVLVVAMAPNDQDSITVEPMPNASGCPTPNREAAIIEQVEPDLNGLESHVTGPTSVTVRVSVDPNGRPGEVTVVSSSGDRLLDDAVVRAARLSKYTPRYVDCKAVAGDYVLLQSLH